MSSADSRRVSLVLPVSSRRAILAATQVAFSLLRTGRVELDLLRGPPDSRGRPAPPVSGPGAILFVAATLPLDDSLPSSLPDLKQQLRTAVERAYARQGITPVEYDLQIL